VLGFLERNFPRTYPGTPHGKLLSGDEQLVAIKKNTADVLKLIGVQIVPFDDSCSVCNAHAHQIYPMDSRPPIPLPNCPQVNQCRAVYAPVIDYGLYRVSQILSARPKLKVQELRQLLKESDK
jgi:hypothetical protein